MAANPILIVGGGIVGTSTAYQLRDADRPVVLAERADQLGTGTTAETFSMFGVEYDVPLEMRRTAWEHYQSLHEAGAIDYEPIGSLEFTGSETTVSELEQTAEEVADVGFGTEILDPAEVRELGVDPPADSRALYIPDAGYFDVPGIIDHWRSAAAKAGVEVRTGTEITDVVTENGRVTALRTGGETIRTDTVVNAAGQWAPALNDMAGVTLPLRHNHGPILVLEVGTDISLPAVGFENGHYFREDGETMAIAGRHGEPFGESERRDPDQPRTVPGEFRAGVKETVRSSVPDLVGADVVDEWVGMRTLTPDGLPVVGETAVSGFYAACGLSGSGITLAPAVGRRVADRILSGDTDSVSSALSPRRFGD